MNYILQSYNLDKIPVEMRGKGVSGLLEMLGLSKTQIIYGYDEEAFSRLAVGTPMVVWNKSDYDKIVEGIDKNRLGHTFLFWEFKNFNQKKWINYIDQDSQDEFQLEPYFKVDLDNKIIIDFDYNNVFYDINDLIDNISRMDDN